MNVIIIEDEPNAVQRLERLMRVIIPQASILDRINSVEGSVKWLKANPPPDLILMDIQLMDGNCFSIFDQCAVVSPVIFTTVYDTHALKAFKVNAIDYILKPIDEEELRAALKKYQNLTAKFQFELHNIELAMQMLEKKYKDKFTIKVGDRLLIVESKEIDLFYSLDKVTFCETNKGRKNVVDFTLDQLEGLLNPAQFFRVNRKYIIAMHTIRDINSHTNSRLRLVLSNQSNNEVIVSRERVRDFKKWINPD
jgi:DNA-binding LytR/AlgR family response regulator